MPLGLDALDHDTIAAWLRERDPAALERLWTRADAVRAAHVGDAVHLRGLVEVSNHCIRHCLYCGIRACSDGITRYRMSADEILACAREAKRLGYGTVVMQSGEDPGLTREFIAGVIRAIKAETGLAMTLSLGEREDEDLRAWKAGRRRPLPAAVRDVGPRAVPTHSPVAAWDPCRIESRSCCACARSATRSAAASWWAFPGQTWDILARDIELFRDLDIDMIGIGPFLPSPRTPLGGEAAERLRAADDEQVPNDEVTTLKVVALTRLVCPEANLPSTTALATLDPATGRELGLAPRREHRDAQRDAARVSRPVRDLPGQGVRPRDRAGVYRAPHPNDRPPRGHGAGGTAPGRRPLPALGAGLLTLGLPSSQDPNVARSHDATPQPDSSGGVARQSGFRPPARFGPWRRRRRVAPAFTVSVGRPRSFTCRSTSRPEMPGSFRSSRRMSGTASAIRSSASSPVSAVCGAVKLGHSPADGAPERALFFRSIGASIPSIISPC